jgi:hypothetical protein
MVEPQRLTLRPWRLILQAWRLTLRPWRLSTLVLTLGSGDSSWSRGGMTWTGVEISMQGGKNWILPKETNANRFFRDSHWLEIWINLLCPCIGPNGGSVSMGSVEIFRLDCGSSPLGIGGSPLGRAVYLWCHGVGLNWIHEDCPS